MKMECRQKVNALNLRKVLEDKLSEYIREFWQIDQDAKLTESKDRQFGDISSQVCLNLAGKMSFLQTASLMKDASMNFVNDSAPLHIASAMNAPVTAIFCSTIPEFGFGPLSGDAFVIQTNKKLECKPCGLHGLNHCPKKHFDCAMTIDKNELLKLI